MEPPIPDDPAPGPRTLVRILIETLQAHGEALSSGDDLSTKLTPQLWSGTAREAFVATGLPKIDTEWHQVAAINRSAVERVSGHGTFLHNLRKLWLTPSTTPRNAFGSRHCRSTGPGGSPRS
jgi:hypothetical protein